MRKSGILIVLAVLLALCPSTFAQEEGRKFAEATFEDEDVYEHYKEWLSDILNVRGCLIRSGIEWSESIERWVKENVQKPAHVEHVGDWRVLTIRSGGLEPDTVGGYYGRILDAFRADLRDIRGEEQAAQRADATEELKKVEAEMKNVQRDALARLRGWDAGGLEGQLQENDKALLELDLAIVELKARQETLSDRLKDESDPLYVQVKTTLVETETELAGQVAKQEALRKQQEELLMRLDLAYEFSARTSDLEEREEKLTKEAGLAPRSSPRAQRVQHDRLPVDPAKTLSLCG